MLKKMVMAWDLDGTLLDSSHRISFKKDGSFDLDYWVKHSHLAKQDTLLPLYHMYKEFEKTGFSQIAVTARVMGDADWETLMQYKLNFDLVLHRGGSQDPDGELKKKSLTDYLGRDGKIPFLAFDDKEENLKVFDEFGFRTMNAGFLNKKIAASSYEEIKGLKASMFSR